MPKELITSFNAPNELLNSATTQPTKELISFGGEGQAAPPRFESEYSFAGDIPTSIGEAVESRQGSFYDANKAAFVDGVVSGLMDVTEEERNNLELKAQAFSDRHGMLVGTLASAPGAIAGDLPLEAGIFLMSGGSANLLNRIASGAKQGSRMARAANRGSKAMKTLQRLHTGEFGGSFAHQLATQASAGALIGLESAFIQEVGGRDVDANYYANRAIMDGIGQAGLFTLFKGMSGGLRAAKASMGREEFIDNLVKGGMPKKDAIDVSRAIDQPEFTQPQRAEGDIVEGAKEASAQLDQARAGDLESTARYEDGKVFLSEDGKDLEFDSIDPTPDSPEFLIKQGLDDSGVDVEFIRAASDDALNSPTRAVYDPVHDKMLIKLSDDSEIGSILGDVGHELTHKAVRNLPSDTRIRLAEMLEGVIKSDEKFAKGFDEFVSERGYTFDNVWKYAEELFAERGRARIPEMKERFFAKLKEEDEGTYNRVIQSVTDWVRSIADKAKTLIQRVGGKKNTMRELNKAVDSMLMFSLGKADANKVKSVIAKELANQEIDAKIADAPVGLPERTDDALKNGVDEPMDDVTQWTEGEADAQRTQLLVATAATADAARAGVTDAPTKDLGKLANKVLYGTELARNTTSLSTDFKEMGLGVMDDLYKKSGEPARDEMFQHMDVLDNKYKETYQVSDDIINRIYDYAPKEVKVLDKNLTLTDAELVDLVMHSRDYTAGTKTNPKTGFGNRSNANSLVLKGYEKADGTKIDLTKEQVVALRDDADIIGDLDPLTRYLRDMTDEFGRAYDTSAKQTGNKEKVTDDTNTAYWGAVSHTAKEIYKNIDPNKIVFFGLESARALHGRTGASELIFVNPFDRITHGKNHSSSVYGMAPVDAMVLNILQKDGAKLRSGVFPDVSEEGLGKELTRTIKGVHDEILKLPNGRERWDTLLGKVEKQQQYINAGDMNKIFSKTLRWYTRGALSFNPGTPIIQLGSVPLAANKMGGDTVENLKLVGDASKEVLAAGGKPYSDEMRQYSKYFYRRSEGMMSPEMAEMVKNETFTRALKKFKGSKTFKAKANAVGATFDAGMKWIRSVDETAINMLWGAAKKKLDIKDIAKATPEQIKELDDLFYNMIESQPNDIKRLKNGFQLSNVPALRSLTMFTSPGSRQFEIMRDASVRYASSEKTASDRAALVTSLIPSIMAASYVTAAGTAVTAGKRYALNDEATRKEIDKAYSLGDAAMNRALRSTVGTVPVAGNIFSEMTSAAITGKSFDVGIPAYELINNSVKTVGSLIHGTESEFRRNVKKLGTNGGIPRQVLDILEIPFKGKD
jgi:hypothetical protein